MKLEKSLVNSFNLTYILETIIHLPLYDVLWNHLNHIILGGKSHNYTQPHIWWCKKISIWKNNAYSVISCYRLTNRFRLETLHSRIVAETMTKNKTEINFLLSDGFYCYLTCLTHRDFSIASDIGLLLSDSL